MMQENESLKEQLAAQKQIQEEAAVSAESQKQLELGQLRTEIRQRNTRIEELEREAAQPETDDYFKTAL